MPSQAAGWLWYDFSSETKGYDAFCKRAFGHKLPFTPVAELAYGDSRTNTALRRTWELACKDERIDALSASHWPLLFAHDANLDLPDAKTYCAKKKLGFVGDNADGSIGTYGVEFTRTDYDGTTCGLGDGAGDGRGDRDDGGDGGGD